MNGNTHALMLAAKSTVCRCHYAGYGWAVMMVAVVAGLSLPCAAVHASISVQMNVQVYACMLMHSIGMENKDA